MPLSDDTSILVESGLDAAADYVISA